MTRLLVLPFAALVGCTTVLGTAPVVVRDGGAIGTMLLRPQAEARSCRATLVGIALGDDAGTLDEALARLLAVDADADVVSDASVSEQRITTGIYDRRCVIVRGDVGRLVHTVTLPLGHAGH